MTSDLILLFGKNGQLGSVIHQKLKGSKCIALDYPEIDFNHPNHLVDLVKQLEPGLIINAAAYTEVDLAEKEKEKAFNINAHSVAAIAETALQLGACLIHYSTDYVFDGQSDKDYKETDNPNPINVYGESKLLGEKKILEIGASFLIFRLSWVYSMTHPSFVKKVLGWSRAHKTLKIVDDQRSNPTWANMVADKTITIIKSGNKNWPLFFQQHQGLYHLSGKGTVSRYDWAKAILEFDPNKPDQITDQILPATSQEFHTLARRPSYSGLDCTKFEKTFRLKIPPWKTSLKQAMTGTE